MINARTYLYSLMIHVEEILFQYIPKKRTHRKVFVHWGTFQILK